MTERDQRPVIPPPKRGWSVLLLLIALLIAGGCSQGEDASPDGPRQERGAFCSDALPCAEAFDCVASRCSTRGEAPLRAILRVTPPGQLDALTTQILPDVLLEGGTLMPDLALSTPVRVQGRVLFDSPDPAARAPVRQAEVRFVESTGLVELRAQASTVSDPRNGRFEVVLPPGRYDVTIRPAQEDIPPARFLDQEISSRDEQRFILPPAGRYRVLRGRLVREDPSSGDLVPLGNARVFAQSPDREYLSTTARSDAEGRFEVLAPVDARQYKLLVRSDGGAIAPSATFEALTLDRDAQAREWLFHLGRWEASVPVAGTLVAPDGETPVPGTVSAQLTSPVDVPTPSTLPENGVALERISFALSAVTDSAGRFELQLFPGTYDLLGASLNREHAVAREEGVRISNGEEAIELALGTRIELTGRVVDDGGTDPLPNAAITFEPRILAGRDAADFTVPIQLLGDSVETDEAGRFRVALQPGLWIANARPTGDSTQTRSWFRLEVDDEREGIELRMRNAADTVGRILDPEGNPLAGAEVDTWLPWGDELLPLAPVITASDGSFRLRIPQRPPSDLGTP